MAKFTNKQAVQAINKHGMLLVYPINNSKEPPSLWSVAHPRTKMKWDWNDHGSDAVANLWHQRMQLSTSNDVVYTKWFRGRATFFSRKVFTALLASIMLHDLPPLGPEAREILEVLESDSPLSTKELKKATGLQGRLNEGLFSRALKELWNRFLIVGFGEVDDGAFPSLAVGSTQVLFEELWIAAKELSPKQTEQELAEFFKISPLAEKFYRKSLNSFAFVARLD